MTTERMGPGFAVFNSHKNDAHDNALRILDASFPKMAYEIREIAEEEGIMVIFNREPTPATSAYVTLVTAFVNGDIVPADEDADEEAA